LVPRDLVLLHGFTNTGACWDPVLAAVGERYRARAPDIRGHGVASGRRPVTLQAVLDDVAAAAPAGPFTLGGYSMGGRIALHAALVLGGVERLVLVGASPGLEQREAREQRRAEDEELAAVIEHSTIEEFARRWALTPVLRGLPPETAKAAHVDRLRSRPSGLAAALRGLGTGALPPLWDRLHELAMPVTLIAGEHDAKFRQVAERMAAAIHHARVVVVTGAGHAVHLEAPEAVASELQAVPAE
jgi:2-succinyl-6-hydroxy-2,4-cyclohexadiene-1-carboxylate synthase